MSSQRIPTADLGDVAPARSRHQGRRSAVTLTDGFAVVGTADGDLQAFDVSTDSGPPRQRWQYDTDGEPSVVAAVPFDGGVVVGERSARGEIRCHDANGDLRWRYETRTDLGDPQQETRFLLPFVASLTAVGDRCYAAARRYERRTDDDGNDLRHFESVVYAFGPDGTIDWSHRTDGSPISIDADENRIAVAYNRCPGDHQHGLVVLDADDGDPRWMWDPGTDGQRRVGDVALLADGAVVSSHGDYCGYRLDSGGRERWRVPLATPTDVGGDTVYAYPNHVHATDNGAVFITGNTYPEEGRETDARHPSEHTAIGVSTDGDHRWDAPVGGFASGLGTDGSLLAVPGAQNFRDRDADDHALRLFDVVDGPIDTLDADGVVTAAAVSDGTAVAVEEPVVYHDEGRERGAYRLHRVGIAQLSC
ncbi:Outer membrane protein assembly factor BamB, contains PQQ-like beta-propeller repeat [Haloarcula vallismortis]|uniref:Tup1 like transcriptional repressor n=2 Tax=Haloarcula vallismortis TaxID=28442 RepID=M0IYT4_HALVA|nr:PQQ-binding-like beta-propeller repeat protein [Haloarcula vallismortis]EMA00615.1 Tup1 like transcriptional repressor [Haloarcula vallismortis ATCC 29715]SDW01512.1 Outer membrane protein assembly factor BamB, contains PQQ-like beta-propeller repeat [Haloarcula vallismortis]